MRSEGFVLEQKPVFDWNHVPVGHVASARRDPKTQTATQLVIALSPEAKTALGVNTLELPASLLFGMRRDEVTLDRSISELKRIDLPHAILKQ